MSKNELELAGAILYKCEGNRLRRDKRYPNTFHYVIEFTNSDPALIKLFLEFLRKIIKINEKRLHGLLFIYDDLNQKRIEKFWSSVTKIPIENFYKIQILHAKNSKYKPNPLGTCKIKYASKEAYLKLNNIIKEKLASKLN